VEQRAAAGASRLTAPQEIHGTPLFMTVFTTARHLSLSSARRIESSYSSTLKSTEIFFCLRLDLPNSLFSSGLPTNILCTFTVSSYMPHHPTHIQLAVPIIQLLITQFFPVYCPSLPLRPKHPLSTLHSNILTVSPSPRPPSGSNYNLCTVLFVFVDAAGRSGAVSLLTST
jgi:hypothetical protein